MERSLPDGRAGPLRHGDEEQRRREQGDSRAGEERRPGPEPGPEEPEPGARRERREADGPVVPAEGAPAAFRFFVNLLLSRDLGWLTAGE